MPHPLATILERAAGGEFPAADGLTKVLPGDGETIAIVAFSGHAFVLADADPAEIARRQTDMAGGGFGGVLAPAVQQYLAGDHREIGSVDVVLVSAGAPRPIAALPRRDDQHHHPRVRRARRHRRNLEVIGDEGGLAILGRGLVGRWELSVELFEPAAPAAGAGRRLVAAGLGLVPGGEWCWAQVAAGNTRSLRTFLAVGFVPVCAEVLITPRDGAR